MTRDFSNLSFALPNGTHVHTCSAALGYSFAAGTTDGPGAFDFKQNNSGEANANPLWAAVRNFLHTPTEEQKLCQGLKPILLDVGMTTRPYAWSPNIVDVQMMRIGQLFIIVAPGEATTMAGRRWKDAISTAAAAKLSLGAQKEGEQKPIVVLGGPANTYTHYIATEEEYSIQRYEGASTLYGPHTLAAHIHLTASIVLPHLFSSNKMINAAAARGEIDLGPEPPIHINSSYSFITPVVYDRPGFFAHFGQVVTDVQPPTKHVYTAGESVEASFIAANPRNNLRLEGTYAWVEFVDSEGGRAGSEDEDDVVGTTELLVRTGPTTEAASSKIVKTDRDWDLIFSWRRTSSALATSEATVTWEIPEGVRKGRYRLGYAGDAKTFGSGKIVPFEGTSGWFEVR